MEKIEILFETISGSKLYGTHSESSDTDIKGVFLPSIEQLVLERASKTFVSSTGSKNDRNASVDIDKSYYSLQYFLQLVSKGETNCVDILFADTNEECVLKTSPIWEKIIANKEKIVTKNIKAFVGYCKSQAIKYSFKGDKLNNYQSFLDFCIKNNGKNVDGSPKKLITVMEEQFGIKKYIPEPEAERFVFHELYKNFGEHVYLLQAKNKESFISISDIKFQLGEIGRAHV